MLIVIHGIMIDTFKRRLILKVITRMSDLLKSSCVISLNSFRKKKK